MDEEPAPESVGRRPSRAVRSAAAVLLLLLLLALVAIASGARGGAGMEAAPRAMPRELFDYLFTLGILFMIGGALSLLLIRPHRRPKEAERGGLLRLLVTFGILMTVAYFGLRRAAAGDEAAGLFERLLERREAAEELGERQGPVEPVRIRWDLLVLVALLGLAATAAAIRRRLRRKPLAPVPALGEELAELLDDTLDDLRAERDARRAVIASYARMERTLAANGLARRPAEAPLEYLGRVLRELEVPAAAALDLTSLFERAKFSPHPIDSVMKDEAIGALVTVRDDLRAAA